MCIEWMKEDKGFIFWLDEQDEDKGDEDDKNEEDGKANSKGCGPPRFLPEVRSAS